jgi:hypothetical protein
MGRRRIRQSLQNRQSWAAMPDERKKDRYALRADGPGWTVYEVWSGNPVVVAGMPQAGLSEIDAKHMAGLLNTQSHKGDSSMRRRP